MNGRSQLITGVEFDSIGSHARRPSHPTSSSTNALPYSDGRKD